MGWRDWFVRSFTWSQWRPLVTRDARVRPDWANLVELRPPDRRSWGDPFPWEHRGAWFLFVEEQQPGQPGHIAVLELDAALRCRCARPVLRQPWHLSYPFLLRHAGELFMVPEAAASGRIDAYRCVRFPDEWVYQATLMDGIAAADPTLVEHDGRWWLFAAVGEPRAAAALSAGTGPGSTGATAAGRLRPAGDAGQPGRTALPADPIRPARARRPELHVFSAASPLSRQWEPHRLNPIVRDATHARPAGRILAAAGSLERPAQDCSVRYGYAVRVQRIERLDHEGYLEREIAALRPPSGRVRGVHTLNRVAGLTAIDAKRRYPRGWH